jgi:hypothetical protein
MPTWEIQLQGNANDLAYLAEHLTSSPTVVRRAAEGDGFLLQSERFDECGTAAEVAAVAVQVAAALWGILKWDRNSGEPLRVGAAIETRPDGGKNITSRPGTGEYNSMGYPAGLIHRDADGKVIPAPPPRLVAIIKLVNSDAGVERAMRLFAADSASWVGLYRILEVVEDDVGGEKRLTGLEWASKLRVKDFKHSANSVQAAGGEARHGVEPGAPPARPMAIEEAQTLVRDLLDNWCKYSSIPVIAVKCLMG